MIGKESGEQKRTRRWVLNEGMSVWFLRRSLTSFVKVKTWTVVVVFLERTFWRNLMTCLMVILRLERLRLWCLLCLMCVFPLLLWCRVCCWCLFGSWLGFWWVQEASVRWDGFSGNQEIWRITGKASQLIRRRMMLSPQQQSSNSSYEEWQTEMEVQGSSWSARVRMVLAAVEDYLNKQLEPLMSPEDTEVNLRYILMNAGHKQFRDPLHERKKERREH